MTHRTITHTLNFPIPTHFLYNTIAFTVFYLHAAFSQILKAF